MKFSHGDKMITFHRPPKMLIKINYTVHATNFLKGYIKAANSSLISCATIEF